MEGLSGQDEWRTCLYAYKDLYPIGQNLLVNDINAVVDGLCAGGADEVHVVDAHGSGNPSPDVLTARLDPPAKQIFRDKRFRQYVDLTEPGIYDAVVVVGMHAKVFDSPKYCMEFDNPVGRLFGRVGDDVGPDGGGHG